MKKKFHVLIAIMGAGILFAQTSDQIKKAKKIVQQSGMSESQVIDAAKARGYTDAEINEAIQKEKNDIIKTKNSKSVYSENDNLSQISQPKEIVNDRELLTDEGGAKFKDEEKKLEDESESELDIASDSQPSAGSLSYFGYDIFSRDPALFQASSVGAVDPNYLIGPGDEIIVMLWGETQFRQVLTVDREGFIFVPEIGQVFVNGLNLNLLESKLFRVFSQSYASLNPQNRTPTTFLDVSLGNLRPLRIQVLGEVAQPGAYTVSPSATLFSSLYYFNGPTTLGSLRDIQLIRNGEKITSIDFYEYLLTGKKPKDKKLQLDDVIFIPRRLKTVSIEGEINRSGIYEVRPEESLSDLINIAGDLKITAYLNRSQIDRIVPFKDRAELGMDRMYTDVNLQNILESEDNFQLQDGDRIQIFSVLDIRQNIVDLRGSVTRPGSYDIGDSLKISELINKADGLLGDAYLERIDVVRIKHDFTEELVQLNLEKALKGDPANDIFLQGLDRVVVYGLTQMVPRKYVSISGHVKNPGRFLLQENMTIHDLIFMSGGFLDQDFKSRTYLGRGDLIRLNDDKITRSIIPFNLGNILDSNKSEHNILLKPDDIIKIYQKEIFISNTPVSIYGVVRNPGNYSYKTDMTLKDLVLEAGGVKDDIYRYKVDIARVNPLNNDLEKYADIITITMDEKFSISPVDLDDESTKIPLNDLANFKLKPFDLVSVRPDPFFSTQKQVRILGEVLYPGDYVILSYKEKITDVIDRAGGLLPNAYPDGSQYIRNGLRINVSLSKILKNPNSNLNFQVLPGDQITIVSKPKIVSINGEVNSSGIHKFVPNKRLRFYLNLSGGLNPNADKDNIWIEYPNGDSKKYNKYSVLSPLVLDGSSITVGKKEVSEPFDQTEFAKELSAIIANIAQAIAVVVLAR